jgi:hypothetical protein
VFTTVRRTLLVSALTGGCVCPYGVVLVLANREAELLSRIFQFSSLLVAVHCRRRSFPVPARLLHPALAASEAPLPVPPSQGTRSLLIDIKMSPLS